MTKDGKGECVGGIAMMLKGANANVVTQRAGKTGRKDTETITRRSKHRAVSEPLGTGKTGISLP